MPLGTETDGTREAVGSFLRGEASWRELEKAGIYVEQKEDGCEIDNPWMLVITASTKDVAHGLLAHSFQPEELQIWAKTILAGSNFLDLEDAFETTSEGRALLAALWDASFGREVNSDAIKAARSLVSQAKSS